MQILGCRVDDALLQAWAERITFLREPLFVAPAHRSLLPPGTVLLSQAELRANHAIAPLDLWDSYSLYEMDRRELEVAFLTPEEIDGLPASARAELMAFQAERGRGQIYPADWLTTLGISLQTEERDRFEAADGPKVVLRHDAWSSLPADQQARWLERFVSQERHPCLSRKLSPEEWAEIDRYHGPQIRLLAGTFAPISGPNCYATTLAAATPLVPLSQSIVGHWLHPEPLLRGLTQRGYQASDLPVEQEQLPPGAALLFRDEEGHLQHASFYLGNGLVLNKDAQSWFAPRQILPLTQHLADWQEDGLVVEVWTKEG